MNLLNFAHPLTDAQKEAIEAHTNQTISVLHEVSPQFDVEQDFTPQVVQMIDDLKIETKQWQGEPWLIIPPSLNYITAVLLAELHARMGHFPTIIRLKPRQDNFMTVYEVAEIINLEQVRQTGRQRR